LDRLAFADRGYVFGVVGCSLLKRPVGPVFVVVLEVLDDQCSELLLVPDGRAVQEFVAQRADLSFSECVRSRSARRNPNGSDARTGEGVVERAGEPSCTVSDQEPEPVIIREAHKEVACCLGGPRTRRVGRDPCEVHPTRVHLNDEQDVEPAQEGGIDTR